VLIANVPSRGRTKTVSFAGYDLRTVRIERVFHRSGGNRGSSRGLLKFESGGKRMATRLRGRRQWPSAERR
jgi:hypothetical protein